MPVTNYMFSELFLYENQMIKFLCLNRAIKVKILSNQMYAITMPPVWHLKIKPSEFCELHLLNIIVHSQPFLVHFIFFIVTFCGKTCNICQKSCEKRHESTINVI